MKRLLTSRQLAPVFIPAILIIAAIPPFCIFSGITCDILTRDVAAITGVNPFTGIISNLGILIWCAAAAICLFGSLILRGEKPAQSIFLTYSGYLTAALMFDDLFEFHESLAHHYLGIDQSVVIIIYIAATMSYLFYFRRAILESDYFFFITALFLFAVSVSVDQILEPWLEAMGSWMFLLEDGSKFIGIISWCAYFLQISFNYVVSLDALETSSNVISLDALEFSPSSSTPFGLTKPV